MRRLKKKEKENKKWTGEWPRELDRKEKQEGGSEVEE